MVATADRNGHSRNSNPPPRFQNTAQPGRTADGRFASGNPGGPGNAYARLSARHRFLFADSIEDKDIVDVTQTLVRHAKEGDMTAARLLLQYAIGKPGEAKDPDRLDQEEWELLKERQNHSIKEMNDALEGFPLGIILGLTKALTQILEDTLRNKFGALGQKPDHGDPAHVAQPRPATPSSAPPPVRNEETVGGIKGTKRGPEKGTDQRLGECVTPPIEPGEVGAVGTTCPSSQEPDFDLDTDLDEGEMEGSLTEEEVLAEYGINEPAHEGKRFQRILASMRHTHRLSVPEVDPKRVPLTEVEGLEPGPDQHPGKCVTPPIKPGDVGAVGTT